MLDVIRLSAEELPAYGAQIAALERDVTYPLGTDRFSIDHGDDYFAFFRRLGLMHYFVALEEGELVGVLAAVERSLPWQGDAPAPCLYLCDLKRRPGAHGGGVLSALGGAFEASVGARGLGAYGVSMNANDGTNRLARLLTRRDPALRAAVILTLFSLDADGARAAGPIVARHRGAAPTWLSLKGVKDIVLESSGQPMPLFHAQFGPCGARVGASRDPVDGAVHMLCAPSADGLTADLLRAGATPSASATVIARGMPGARFDFVLTSDI